MLTAHAFQRTLQQKKRLISNAQLSHSHYVSYYSNVQRFKIWTVNQTLVCFINMKWIYSLNLITIHFFSKK